MEQEEDRGAGGRREAQKASYSNPRIFKELTHSADHGLKLAQARQVSRLMVTLQTFEAELFRLCRLFEANRHLYRRNAHDETSLRLEYLDPFFTALGWDVSNKLGHPPHLRECRVEYKTQDGLSKRRADYVFRIGGLDRFVCEAKKFPERLENGHYQIQNYVFNLRMWIGLITNFDEFHLFVVGGKPDRKKPFATVLRLNFTEYSANAKKLFEPPRVRRRPFGLSYAAIAGSSSIA